MPNHAKEKYPNYNIVIITFFFFFFFLDVENLPSFFPSFQVSKFGLGYVKPHIGPLNINRGLYFYFF